MSIDTYFEKIKNLPASPVVLARLMATLKKDDVTAHDIENVLKLDMSLSAQVIRISNSDEYSTGEPCSDIEEAVSRIGMEETYVLLNSLVGVEFSKLENTPEFLNSHAIWSESMACAACMEILATELSKNTDSAYSVGLFHNIGMLVINQLMGDEYAAVIEISEAKDIPIRHAEKEILGFNYVDVGSTLLEHWEFDREISQAILHQYDPGNCTECPDLASMLHLSLYILADLGLMKADEAVSSNSAHLIMGRLGVSDEVLNHLESRILERVAQVSTQLK